MSGTFFGIYGFNFAQRHSLSSAQLEPLYKYPECRTRAESQNQLLLTGYGVLSSGMTGSAERAAVVSQRIADGMTFCEQRLVLVTRPIRLSRGDSIPAVIRSGRLPANIPILSSRSSSGALIDDDTFMPESRARFLDLFLAHLDAAPRGDPLTAAMYRQIEVWRLSKQFVEVEHFLVFSGLEILARAYGPNPTNRNVAVPLTQLLTSHGFSVTQLMVEEWTAARNALFHRGQLEATVPNTGQTVNVPDQLYTLGTLLADLSLKRLGFEDGHINWNRWLDGMPFGQ